MAQFSPPGLATGARSRASIYPTPHLPAKGKGLVLHPPPLFLSEAPLLSTQGESSSKPDFCSSQPAWSPARGSCPANVQPPCFRPAERGGRGQSDATLRHRPTPDSSPPALPQYILYLGNCCSSQDLGCLENSVPLLAAVGRGVLGWQAGILQGDMKTHKRSGGVKPCHGAPTLNKTLQLWHIAGRQVRAHVGGGGLLSWASGRKLSQVSPSFFPAGLRFTWSSHLCTKRSLLPPQP